MPKRRGAMTYAAVETMLLGWPGVERSTSYGRPSLKVAGRFFTWVKEDGDSIVLGDIDFDEREMLMETQGEVFYITDRNSRAVDAAVEDRSWDRRSLPAPPLVCNCAEEAACGLR